MKTAIEMLRVLQRSILAWNRCRRVVGLAPALRWLLLHFGRKVGIREPEKWRVRPRQVSHALTARLRGSSDMSVFYQIFVSEEYAIVRDLRNVSLVLDLGANVGFSSAVARGGSGARPAEPGCLQNQSQAIREQSAALHGAAWAECMRLQLSQDSSGDGREWAMQVSKPSGSNVGDVQAWDVGSLMEMAGAVQVDLLKVDIEGAELSVFGPTAKEWLPGIRNICAELHGPDCEEALAEISL